MHAGIVEIVNPGLNSWANVWCWRTEDDTRRTALALARALESLPGPIGLVLCLSGDLGLGKTTFVRHCLQALGVQGRIKSPTYALMESYEVAFPKIAAALTATATLQIHHFDFYRMADPAEFEEAGLREVLSQPGLHWVEWPEKAPGLVSQADVLLELSLMADDSRQVRIQARSPQAQAWLQATQQLLAQQATAASPPAPDEAMHGSMASHQS